MCCAGWLSRRRKPFSRHKHGHAGLLSPLHTTDSALWQPVLVVSQSLLSLTRLLLSTFILTLAMHCHGLQEQPMLL